ncbi:MAG TPA: hypothetical protein PLL64_05025 [Rhodothermales bacterium]|nr:hypothetical protein [Rhodothermales bacterium]
MLDILGSRDFNHFARIGFLVVPKFTNNAIKPPNRRFTVKNRTLPFRMRIF